MKDSLLYTLKGVAGCMLLAAATAACTQEDSAAEADRGKPQTSYYVSLSFVSSGSRGTRANPAGGESGDGAEHGQDYENKITSAVAFFYQGQGSDGANSDGTQRILAAVTFNNLTQTAATGSNVDCIYTTGPQECDIDNGTYDVLVVANPGGDWWTAATTLTLADVRDHLQTQAWTEATEGYSGFVMTSAADAQITINYNTKDDPATTEVEVERMAARLDYKAEASYECEDPQYAGATVEITGAAPVNNLTAGSYLIKRVADNADGTATPEYMGDETADATGAATNYVLDPWTAQKTASNSNGSNFIVGTEATSAAGLYGTFFSSGSEDPGWWASYVKAGTPVSDGTETWQRIGYTLENTTAAGESGTLYNTGVVFKATFHPAGLDNYSDGSTFFAIGRRLFASMEDMMAHFYGKDNFDGMIDNCKSWDELEANFTALLLDNDPSGYKSFLEGQDKAQDFATLKESLKWKAYMLAECGYSATLADGKYTVTLDQGEGTVTRIKLKSHGVRTYKDATCYYTWWVRHANDGDDDAKGIMEYATVRNNIYKLDVQGVYSLGGDVPGDDGNLILDVYVKDWNLLREETLPM